MPITEIDTPLAPNSVPGTPACIVREFGPELIPGATRVNGVTHDGRQVWAATGPTLVALDPVSGSVTRTLEQASDAGTAFDGRYLWQLSESRIDKIDPESGAVVATIPAPGDGGSSGMAYAEGSLWIGQYQDRRIVQVDPANGKVIRSIESNRFVTGVTWVDGELWHATWEGDESDLRHIDAHSGAVLERLDMPAGVGISGLESDGAGLFYCGGGGSGMLRVVQHPAVNAGNGGA